jgi:uncharacterized damage-inducible protein DinB
MLRNAIIDIYDQTDQVLNQLGALNGTALTEAFTDSGVGRHLRHMQDHERALQASLKSGLVDYNRRQRDEPGERNLQVALHTGRFLRQAWLDADLSDRPVEVLSEISLTGSHSLELQSTLWRELMYMIHHNIHHLAYMRLLLKSQGVRIPEHIGQAPATASYLRTLNAAGR